MTAPYSDDEIDNLIWSEIESSDSKGDFICYVIQSPGNAKFLASAKDRIETQTPSDNLAPVHYFKAIERIRELAEANDPVATFHMGKVYALGIAVLQNLDEGIRWYRKAIALGEPRAYANLGWFYQSGHGVSQNKEKAFELLSYGAEHGVVSARAAIGIMLLTGEGCPRVPAAGLAKLEEAFNDGYLNAGNHLADLYFEGKNVPKDTELGHGWLMKVANRGDERTMAILGHYLLTGSHGKKDPETGLKLMQQAVQHQFLPAYLWLGTLYKKGEGVSQDLEKAIDLFKAGVTAGDTNCEKALSLLLAEQSTGNVPPPKSFH